MQFIGEGGKLILEQTFALAVAETVVRAVLAGRENFEIPIRSENAQIATSEFLKWFEQITDRLEQVCRRISSRHWVRSSGT